MPISAPEPVPAPGPITTPARISVPQANTRAESSSTAQTIIHTATTSQHILIAEDATTAARSPSITPTFDPLFDDQDDKENRSPVSSTPGLPRLPGGLLGNGATPDNGLPNRYGVVGNGSAHGVYGMVNGSRIYGSGRYGGYDDEDMDENGEPAAGERSTQWE